MNGQTSYHERPKPWPELMDIKQQSRQCYLSSCAKSAGLYGSSGVALSQVASAKIRISSGRLHRNEAIFARITRYFELNNVV